MNMSSIIFTAEGGSVVLPDKVLCDRRDGGHPIVNPPCPVRLLATDHGLPDASKVTR
jgi:hypothetical protein